MAMSYIANKKTKLDIECIFSDLKAKFYKLEVELVSKSALIALKCNVEVEKVENVFDSNKAIQIHEARINEQRQILLDKNKENMIKTLKRVEEHR
jgi:hypothetical protein